MGLRDEDVKYEEGKAPAHVKNEAGRVFIATPVLLARKDMTPVYDYKPPVASKSPAENPVGKEFKLGKATKQQIVTKAQEDFNAELSMDSTAKELRAQFKELMDASDNDS